MDNCFENNINAKLKAKGIDKRWQTAYNCMHIPATCIIGYSKEGDPEAAAISTRWLYEKWTNPTQFKAWTGFMPSTSKSGEVEILKAAGGKVFQFENMPTEGFRLVLRQDGRYERWDTDSRCGILRSNGQCASPQKQGSRVYMTPTVEVRDPRGWTFIMSVDQLVELLAEGEKRELECNGLNLPGPLVYVFSNSGFTLDFPDGKLASNALSDEEVLECKSSAKKTRQAAEPEFGKVYVNAEGTRYLCIGKLPKLVVSHQKQKDLETTMVDEMYDILHDALYVPGWHNDLTRAQHLKGAKSKLSVVARTAVQSFLNKNNPESFMPWNDEDYVKAVKDLRKQLSDACCWTFIKLGNKRDDTRDLDSTYYQAAPEELACRHAFFDKAEIDSIFNGKSVSYSCPWLYFMENVKQTTSLAEARDLATCKTSTNMRFTDYTTYKHPYAVVTAEQMLKAANERKQWLLQCLAAFETLFPIERPNVRDIEEYAETVDDKLAANPNLWKLVFPARWEDISLAV